MFTACYLCEGGGIGIVSVSSHRLLLPLVYRAAVLKHTYIRSTIRLCFFSSAAKEGEKLNQPDHLVLQHRISHASIARGGLGAYACPPRPSSGTLLTLQSSRLLLSLPRLLRTSNNDDTAWRP